MSVQITGSAKGLTKAYENAQNATKKFAQVTNKVSASLRRMGSAAIAAVGALAGFIGLASGASFFAGAIRQAGNMEEALDKMGRVFEENFADAKKGAIELGKELGRSRGQMVHFVTDAGTFLKALGFAEKDLVKMSTQLAQAAVDMASFHDGIDEDLFTRFRAAMAGSGEVMTTYGIILNETTVKAELLAQGLKKTTATPLQIAQARWNILMRGAAESMNNASETIKSYTNSVKVLRAELDNLKGSIGTFLLPAITRFVHKLQEVVTWLQRHGAAIAKNTLQIGSFVAAFTTLVFILPKVYLGLKKLVEAIRAFTIATVIAESATGWGLVKVAVGLLGATAAALYAGKMFDDLMKEFDETQDSASNTAKAVDKVTKSVKNAAEEAAKAKKAIAFTFAPGGVGAVTAGTTAGFSAVQSGRQQLILMLQLMRDAKRERKKQTEKLGEISANTADKLRVKVAVI